MKFERKCSICGKSYSYCPNCSDFDYLPRWMELFCSENCHELYLLINRFYTKHSTREDTLKELNGLDLSRYEYYPIGIKRAIKGIKNEKVISKNQVADSASSVESGNNV